MGVYDGPELCMRSGGGGDEGVDKMGEMERSGG